MLIFALNVQDLRISWGVLFLSPHVSATHVSEGKANVQLAKKKLQEIKLLKFFNLPLTFNFTPLCVCVCIYTCIFYACISCVCVCVFIF